MLYRQIGYFLSKYGTLAKFTAAEFLHRTMGRSLIGGSQTASRCHSSTAPTPHFTIHLESAVFMFHMTATTQGITGSPRAACSEPVQRFLACPFS
jgi:hypothetical protein